MKKLFFVTTFLLAGLLAKAQGNLQFNQVKLVAAVQTVPAGKVWKVESAHISQSNCVMTSTPAACVSGTNTYFLSSGTYVVNGTNFYLGAGTGGDNARWSFPSNPFPLWLPAGSTLAAGTNIGFLSVIEFNIVP